VTEEQLAQLEEDIQSDIIASLNSDDWAPLSIYRYTKDDLHLLVLDRFELGDTTEASIDYVLSNWEYEDEQVELQSSRDILITRYEEYRE